MNTAFLDAQNLAWKIHHVESGFADRSILKSYESERKHIAENLLDFDAKYAKLFSTRQPSSDVASKAQESGNSTAHEENAFVKTFKESCEFTSGYGVAYQPNTLNWSPDAHPAKSPLFLKWKSGTELRTGRIMHTAMVTRVVDANVVHLVDQIPTNGAFRIFVFGGRPSAAQKSALASFATHSLSPSSYLGAFLFDDLSKVDYHERYNAHSRFFSFCTVIAAKRPEIDIAGYLPELLARYADNCHADDVWDLRVPDAKAAAHAKMGFSDEEGGVVVVRPDGYVGCAVKLVNGSGTVDALNEYFGAFTAKKLGASTLLVEASARL